MRGERVDFSNAYLGPRLQPPVTAAILGHRLQRLRLQLQLTPEQAALQAGVTAAELLAFEADGTGTVQLLLQLVGTLQSAESIEELFTVPKFTSIEQVVAWERKRREGQL